MFEPILSVVAILAIIGLARAGALFGAFYEMASTFLLFLAMMFALRYWYPVTVWLNGWFTGGSCFAAFEAYWGLFLVGCAPLILVMTRVTEQSRPKYPRALDTLLGMIFGAISSTILVCCLLTSVSVIAPKLWAPYTRQGLLVPLDVWPISVYRTIEQDGLHIAPTSPGHTRFPTFEKADADDPSKYWK